MLPLVLIVIAHSEAANIARRLDLVPFVAAGKQVDRVPPARVRIVRVMTDMRGRHRHPVVAHAGKRSQGARPFCSSHSMMVFWRT